MKLSLRWLFDHLDCKYESINISALIDDIGQRVVEIEEVHTLVYAPASFIIACVESISTECVRLYTKDTKQIIQLPFRANIEINQSYFVNNHNSWQWTTLKDAGSSKEGLFPAVDYTTEWSAQSLIDDTLLTISNTAITHRPDLWSHRGFAREISVLLQCCLIAQEQFLSSIDHTQSSETKLKGIHYSLEVKPLDVCSALGLLSINITNNVSNPQLALRLAAVDVKPINLLVDAGNYTMIDWGQPLHVYDASQLKSNLIGVDMAQPNEHLILLDGRTLKTSDSMLMVYDDQTPLSLAGIMGGSESSIGLTTTTILVESACFNAQVIRKSAQEAHIRTEASTRFEKELDTTLVLQGLQRFLCIAKNYTDIPSIHNCIIYQTPLGERSITIKHVALEKILGIAVEQDFIINNLTALGFTVLLAHDTYSINVPSWRLKDVHNSADIAEEIGRLYGWNNFSTALPRLALSPHKVSKETKIAQLKRTWAYTQHAREVLNYPVWNQELFSLFNWHPTGQPSIQNPVSHTAKLLVSSLIPSMVYNCIKNIHSPYKRLSFFEINAVWHKKEDIKELTSWAIVYCNPDEAFNFAQQREALCSTLLSIGYTARLQACPEPPFVWYDTDYCAQIFVNTTLIGYAGRLAPTWSDHINAQMFIAEIDLDTLFAIQQDQMVFKEPSKFQSSWLDVSIMLSYQRSIEHVINDIMALEARITDATLHDIFVKQEWVNQRSVTLRFTINDSKQQLTKSSLEDIQKKIYAYCAQQDIIVR